MTIRQLLPALWLCLSRSRAAGMAALEMLLLNRLRRNT